MITTNACDAANFKLQPASHYFSNKQTVALLTAALSGDMVKAKELVREGANPNDEGPATNRYNRLRLLHYSIAARNRDAVTILVGVGADPELNTIGSAGPALLFAMNQDDVDMLSLLLDLRPPSQLSKETVEDLLFESVTLSRSRCLELVLKRGAPIDFPDSAGYTIMMRAIDAQDYEMAESLIMKGASVHVEAKGGMTPAYSIQYDLQKFKPGSPTYNKVLRIKKLMEEKGAVFPALTPAEVRAKRAKQ